MTSKNLSTLAADLGLEQAYQIDPEAFAAARDRALALAERIAKARSLADEPGHIFRVPDDGGSGPDDAGSGA